MHKELTCFNEKGCMNLQFISPVGGLLPVDSKVQECDATMNHSSIAAGSIKKIIATFFITERSINCSCKTKVRLTE
jgi:hypothetical protein